MHVGKPYDQRSLTSHMPGRRAFEMPRPVPVGGHGQRQNARYTLVKSTGFFIFFFGFWPTDLIGYKLLNRTLGTIPCMLQVATSHKNIEDAIFHNHTGTGTIHHVDNYQHR